MTAAGARKRQPHTRSREGCTACRKRHRRCDEVRPSCGYCISVHQVCTYPGTPVPLRERRVHEKQLVLPGIQQIWSLANTPPHEYAEPHHASSAHRPTTYTDNVRLIKLSGGPRYAPAASIDPFQTMAVNMPLNSIPLMRYYFDTASVYDVAVEPKRDCLSRVVHDPAALRSAILLAGVHCAWNTGQLAHYETTYLHHMTESIRVINKQLAHPALQTAYLDCVRQIATVAMVEACFGNISLAEIHVAGLLAYMDKCGEPVRRTIQDEFADRYVLLVSSFIYGTRFRIHDTLTFGHKMAAASAESPVQQASAALHKWHELEQRGLYVRMQAFRLMPGFLAAPAHVPYPPWPIDVNGALEQLRIMTRCIDRRAHARDAHEYAAVWNDFWISGAPTELFRQWVDSHANSEWERPSYARDALLSSWCGIHAAGALYMSDVVYAPLASHILEKRLHHKHRLLVERDLEDFVADIDLPMSKPAALWLWKAFAALMSSEQMAWMDDQQREFEGQASVSTFQGFVRAWVDKSRNAEWEEAKKMLELICWPQIPTKDRNARVVWERALQATGHGVREVTV